MLLKCCTQYASKFGKLSNGHMQWHWIRLFESPLDNKDIKTVNPKGNQPLAFIERTDAEAEAPILRPPDAKSWLTGKDPDAGKDWKQEEKRGSRDEMIGWHHQLKGHEFEQTLGDSEGRKAWHAAVHGVSVRQTGLSDWTRTTLPTRKFAQAPEFL